VTGFTFRAGIGAILRSAKAVRLRLVRDPAMLATAALRPPAHVTRGLRATLAATWPTVAHDLFDPYRPERHYMRGPGPKWRAKHACRATHSAHRTPKA
jgi:hypothetical protein